MAILGEGIFLYEKTKQGVCIFACKSMNDTAFIPEQIDGLPVTELAPYVFSERRIQQPEGKWSNGETGEFGSDSLPLLCGDRLTAVFIPETVRKIGNYAFYNCYRLKRIVCHSTLEDLGSGMFTGCSRMAQVEITVAEGKKSCMKELLSEIRERLTVRYISGDGEARLIFPEYYEEAVENTPARILYTTTHGAGHRYRYCFQDTVFQFKDYDAQFSHETARETAGQALELAFNRLMYPLHLSEDARREYVDYINQNWAIAAEFVMRQKNLAQVKCLSELSLSDRSGTEELLRAASRFGFTEAAAYLMDYGRNQFVSRRKKFEL